MNADEWSSGVQELWDHVATDWDRAVGDDGDANRRLNSDPVLWRMVGDVRGLVALDAGCGPGYLARKLHEKGATVTGVDLSPKMIEIARSKTQAIDFHVDSCIGLVTLADETFDLLVANYVLMDVSDLAGAVRAFSRVLKPGGVAVLILSHPCFPQSYAKVDETTGVVSYHWPFNYYEESRHVDEPWGGFDAHFIWFHRPLSMYWRAFADAGFDVVDLDEPRITPERYHLAESERKLHNSRTRPYSLALKLRKRATER